MEGRILLKPENWTDLQWLDYQSSYDGITVPVETIPSPLPAYFRLGRRWEKKFSISQKEAMKIAKQVIEEVFSRIPSPEEIRELEASYKNWDDLKGAINALTESLKKEDPSPEDLMEVGKWVFTNENLNSLLNIKRRLLEEESEETEEEEENRKFPQAEGTAWRYLPIFPDPDEERQEEEERKKLFEQLSPEQLQIVRGIEDGRKWYSILETWKKFYAQKDDFPPYWRERVFLSFKAQKTRFEKIKREVKNHLHKKYVKSGDGKGLYAAIRRQTCLSKKEIAELWERFRKEKKK